MSLCRKYIGTCGMVIAMHKILLVQTCNVIFSGDKLLVFAQLEWTIWHLQVCELDIIFNFEKAYFMLDELLLGGELQETSKKNVLKAISAQDLMQEVKPSLFFACIIKCTYQSKHIIILLWSGWSLHQHLFHASCCYHVTKYAFMSWHQNHVFVEAISQSWCFLFTTVSVFVCLFYRRVKSVQLWQKWDFLDELCFLWQEGELQRTLEEMGLAWEAQY